MANRTTIKNEEQQIQQLPPIRESSEGVPAALQPMILTPTPIGVNDNPFKEFLALQGWIISQQIQLLQEQLEDLRGLRNILLQPTDQPINQKFISYNLQ